jgi:hypothetical protein
MGIEFDDNSAVETGKKIADAVCPLCFHHVIDPTIMTEGTDQQGRQLRTYFGYCSKCSAAHVVIQFVRNGRWVIHKYRPAIVLEASNEIEVSQNWQLMNELPPARNSQQPAPVVIGPGGDFTKEITPELKSFSKNIKIMQNSLGNLLKKIEEMLDANDK